MLDLPILSISISLPLISSLYITLFIGHSKLLNRQSYAVYVAILSSILTLISTIYLLVQFDKNNKTFQFVEHYNWVKQIGLEFYVGVDGVSIFLIFLTALLTLICVITSLFTIKKQIKEFLLCFMLLEAFCIGAFCSLNLLLFYFFFEVALIPIYIIIGIWGDKGRSNAAMKFFVSTFCGSCLFLISLIYIYTQANTLNIPQLILLVPNFSTHIQQILWFSIFIAFAVKIPITPFHKWLLDANVKAPIVGSIILTGVLFKLGVYGFFRILLPILSNPSKEFCTYVVWTGICTMFYASLIAFTQKDVKKITTYLSTAQIGLVIGGIFSLNEQGTNGAIFQMLNHSIVYTALFLIIGVLYERYNTRHLAKYGKIAIQIPVLGVVFTIAILGCIGMPGTSGFIGQLNIMLGLFKVNHILFVIAILGIISGTICMLRLYIKVMFGGVLSKIPSSVSGLSCFESITMLPMIALIIYFGLLHSWIIDWISIVVL